ncbi:MAG TPA: YheU family protein [Gammaproteobacteria bacterium]|nr:YheU family protein [Gammaproteobacteria bacterium]HIL96056.1 YheU family protein [Pseudomonadales bacterium]
MTIPWQSLSDDALRGVIEDFVSREGTEYGTYEISMAEKVTQVRHQLQKNEVAIVFDSQTDSCSIVPVTRLG